MTPLTVDCGVAMTIWLTYSIGKLNSVLRCVGYGQSLLQLATDVRWKFRHHCFLAAADVY